MNTTGKNPHKASGSCVRESGVKSHSNAGSRLSASSSRVKSSASFGRRSSTSSSSEAKHSFGSKSLPKRVAVSAPRPFTQSACVAPPPRRVSPERGPAQRARTGTYDPLLRATTTLEERSLRATAMKLSSNREPKMLAVTVPRSASPVPQSLLQSIINSPLWISLPSTQRTSPHTSPIIHFAETPPDERLVLRYFPCWKDTSEDRRTEMPPPRTSVNTPRPLGGPTLLHAHAPLSSECTLDSELSQCSRIDRGLLEIQSDNSVALQRFWLDDDSPAEVR